MRLPLQPKSPLTIGTTHVELADALNCYSRWARPTAIVADGPYGLGKFEGEPKTPDDLAQWYEPHVAAWSRWALPETTLWFWCSEVGWAEVHPMLKAHGWKYRAAHVWDKGIGHVAGNCNGDTIRGFPVVTEVCVQYIRDVRLADEHGELLQLKLWLRHEWQRSGLPLSSTNEACGVKNAATRKYFTQCHLWYFPPPDKMNALAAYAQKHGRRTSRPYFSLDGRSPFSAEEWVRLRAKWNHAHGITNVWTEPAIRGAERLKGAGLKVLHINQKPLKLIERLLLASTDPGDAVWEPFGGLFSTAAAAIRTGRRCYGAELNPEYYSLAIQRLRVEAANVGGEEGQHRGPARPALGALWELSSRAGTFWQRRKNRAFDTR